MNILNALLDSGWMLQPESLQKMHEIVMTHKEGSIEALQSKIGEPLKNSRKTSIRGSVAVIPVSGPIFRHANLFTEICGATSLDTLATDFQTALDDPQVSGIIFEIDSPGGAAAGIHEFSQMIFASRGVKPIKAYIGALGASAAYFIAAGCSEIVVDRMAAVGSIGVVTTLTKNSDDSKLTIVSSQSPNKRLDLDTDEGKSKVQTMLDDLAAVFISAVGEYRKMSEEAVMEAGDHGGTRIGQKAVDAGLADRIGSLEGLIKEMQEDKKLMSEKTPNAETAAELTVAAIKAEHPAIANELIAEGAKTERERIQGVEAAAVPGTEDLISSLKYDGKTTPEQASVQVLQKLKSDGAAVLTELTDEAPDVIAATDTDESEDVKIDAAANGLVKHMGGKTNV